MSLCFASMTFGALGAADWYHLETAIPNCFEVNYTDSWYKWQGYKPGHCPKKWDITDSYMSDQVCDQHSHDIGVKDCPTRVVTVEHVKKGTNETMLLDVGKNTQNKVVSDDSENWYHLETTIPNCFEVNYTDSWYKWQNYKGGHCPKKWDITDSYMSDKVCDQHSHDDNVKDCPTKVVTVEHVKKGTNEPLLGVGKNADITITSCGGAATDPKFSYSPNPAVVGSTVTITGSGIVAAGDSAPTYSMTAKYGAITLIKDHTDTLCKKTSISLPLGIGAVDIGGYKSGCPIKAGANQVDVTIPVKNLPGTVTGAFKVYSSDGTEQFCINLAVKV